MEILYFLQFLTNLISCFSHYLNLLFLLMNFSCWTNIDRIENTEHLTLLEESLRKSIERIQFHKVCYFYFPFNSII